MPRRILQGTVVSDKNDKTITVRVERRIKHPLYKKFVKRSKKYAAHDEQNTAHMGDTVAIIEGAPISKTKRWTLHKIVKRSEAAEVAAAAAEQVAHMAEEAAHHAEEVAAQREADAAARAAGEATEPGAPA